MKPNSFKQYNNLFTIFHYLSKYRIYLYSTFLLLSLSALTVLSIGASFKYFTNQGLTGILSLKKSILFFAGLLLVLSVASACRSYLIELLCHKMCSDIRKDLYKKVMQLQPEYLESNRLGNIQSKIMHDVSTIHSVIPTLFSFFIRNLLMLIGGIILLFITSVYLTTITIIIVPIALYPLLILGKKLKTLATNSNQINESLSSKIDESVHAIKEIQAYCQEKKEVSIITSIIQTFIQQVKRKLLVRSVFVGGVIFVVSYVVIGIFWLGSYQVILSNIQPGDLASFVFYAIVVASSLAGMSEVYTDANKAAAAADNICKILELKTEEKAAHHLPKTRHLEFTNVSFFYPSRSKNIILKKFNLNIKEGEKIAITGPSGCGKTTILQLLLKFYQPTDGQIFFGNTDLQNISTQQLRNTISYVSQDPYIFEATLKDNLTYGNNKVSQKELDNIITAIGLDRFIKTLPQGYNTTLNKKATNLSGGQKHRIALARALLRKSSILLLDEVTTGLDKKNEELIYNLIKKDKRTLVIVTHKQSLAKICDRTIKLK